MSKEFKRILKNTKYHSIKLRKKRKLKQKKSRNKEIQIKILYSNLPKNRKKWTLLSSISKIKLKRLSRKKGMIINNKEFNKTSNSRWNKKSNKYQKNQLFHKQSLKIKEQNLKNSFKELVRN